MYPYHQIGPGRGARIWWLLRLLNSPIPKADLPFSHPPSTDMPFCLLLPHSTLVPTASGRCNFAHCVFYKNHKNSMLEEHVSHQCTVLIGLGCNSCFKRCYQQLTLLLFLTICQKMRRINYSRVVALHPFTFPNI